MSASEMRPVAGVPIPVWTDPPAIMFGPNVTENTVERKCLQCGADLNPVAWILGPVCGKCCRKNHKAATR